MCEHDAIELREFEPVAWPQEIAGCKVRPDSCRRSLRNHRQQRFTVHCRGGDDQYGGTQLAEKFGTSRPSQYFGGMPAVIGRFVDLGRTAVRVVVDESDRVNAELR